MPLPATSTAASYAAALARLPAGALPESLAMVWLARADAGTPMRDAADVLADTLRILTGLNADADVMVLTRRQDITGRGEWLMNIDFVAVAHRDHPLCMLDAPLDEDALRAWPLIRIADRDNPQQAVRDAWTFSTIDAAIEAVMYQVGYGWLPEERIQQQLEQGLLRPLPLSHGARRATPLHLIVKDTLAPLDEQVTTLLRLLREH